MEGEERPVEEEVASCDKLYGLGEGGEGVGYVSRK